MLTSNTFCVSVSSYFSGAASNYNKSHIWSHYCPSFWQHHNYQVWSQRQPATRVSDLCHNNETHWLKMNHSFRLCHITFCILTDRRKPTVCFSPTDTDGQKMAKTLSLPTSQQTEQTARLCFITNTSSSIRVNTGATLLTGWELPWRRRLNWEFQVSNLYIRSSSVALNCWLMLSKVTI